MSRIRVCLSLIILLLGTVGCGPTSVETEEPAQSGVTSTSVPPTDVPPTAEATSQPTPDNTLPTRTPYPTSTYAHIYSLILTDDPDSEQGRTVFPQGTKEIWAVMGYSGMQEGTLFKRVWYKDGTIWITKEDPWDFAKYGANGTLKDISIYDHEAGLPEGLYELQIYVDDNLQYVGDGGYMPITFQIAVTKTGTVAFKSPDGTQSVLLEYPGTLRLACELCDDTPLAEHTEIESVHWFPDSQHILYVVVDRSGQISPPSLVGVDFSLWIVDINDPQPYSISLDNENLRAPLISPNGDYVAAPNAGGRCEAGMCSHALWFIRLDHYQRAEAQYHYAFGGDGAPEMVTPPVGGQWVSATEFEVAIVEIASSVSPEEDLSGLYRFNLSTMTVERVGDYPPP